MENNEDYISNLLGEPNESHGINFPLKKETYEIIGICMDVYNNLGSGFSEVVYKDAIEEEFKLKSIHFDREKNYKINYKGITLKHSFTADFVVHDSVLLEIKARYEPIESFFQQTLNYLAVTRHEVGLIINFISPSLEFKRILPRNNSGSATS